MVTGTACSPAVLRLWTSSYCVFGESDRDSCANHEPNGYSDKGRHPDTNSNTDTNSDAYRYADSHTVPDADSEAGNASCSR